LGTTQARASYDAFENLAAIGANSRNLAAALGTMDWHLVAGRLVVVTGWSLLFGIC